MIPYSPANPMKGRGAVRFPLDCRKPLNRERMLLVAQTLPNHYLCTGHIHYLSSEALNVPIEELRTIKKVGTVHAGMAGKADKKAKLLKDLEKIKKGIQRL